MKEEFDNFRKLLDEEYIKTHEKICTNCHFYLKDNKWDTCRLEFAPPCVYIKCIDNNLWKIPKRDIMDDAYKFMKFLKESK